VFAAHEARHGCRAKGGCRRERGTRHFGFVAKAIRHHRRFCVYFCHKPDFTGYLAPAARKYPAPRKYRAGGPDISKKSSPDRAAGLNRDCSSEIVHEGLNSTQGAPHGQFRLKTTKAC
jgi:hypothetical protein